MKNWSYICLFLLLSGVGVQAQDVAAYVDRMGRFQYYEDGYVNQLDHQEVPKFALGGDFLIYLNSRDEVVYYRKGRKEELHLRDVFKDYTITQFLVLNRTNKVFSAINHRRNVTLSLGHEDLYEYGDSIVAFIEFNQSLKVYYDDEITVALPNNRPVSFKVSDNSVAFINHLNALNFYKNEELSQITDVLPINYEVGHDLVLFTDEYEEFKMWRNGEIVDLADYPTKSYKIGDRLAAYVDDQEAFYMIDVEAMEAVEVMPVVPKFYDVIDNTLIYVDDRNYFNVYYEGKNHILETYQPDKFEYYNGVVAYVDFDGRLKAFYEGEKVEVSTNIINSFKLFGRVILYELGNGDYTIYHKGKRFNQE